MRRQVDFYRHSLSADDAGAVAAVLQTPILTSGSVGKAVEAQLCDFFGAGFAGLVNSWTNGAVAALLALDIGPGDEVIVPAMTFIASSNVVELVGAKPVFVDVEPDTLLMSLPAMTAAVTARTRAVIPVHLYGQMVDMRALKAALAGRPDIAVIEDCAHCFEGTFDGEPPGRHSDIAIFSFYATKNVTCGEGGAFITNSEELYRTMLQTRLHGMSAGAADRYSRGGYRHWDMARLGVKANLPDLLAALLPKQIKTIREQLGDRTAMANRYEEALADTPIRTVRVGKRAASAWHLFPIHVTPSQRDEAIAALNENGIGVTVNYRSVPTLSYYAEKYGYRPDSFPTSYAWGEGTISLPLFPGLTRDDQDYVIAVLKDKIVPLLKANSPAAAFSQL
jgi:UDP-4-amino-4-deoxy-L-arabinose-oxoglutarate aminotransferase